MRTPQTSLHAAPWLLVTSAVTLAPHAIHLPVWLVALCIALLIWRAAGLRAPGRSAPRILVVLIAIAAAAAIRLEYGHILGRDPGIALLALLLCLKQLEITAPRDVRVGVLLSLFLQLALFFHHQTLPVALLATGGALLATTTLLTLVAPTTGTRDVLKTALTLLAQAVPFMLVLFLLFPRIPGPLWGLPADAHSGLSGLSDTMEPGSISELSLSDAIAFRARFEGSPPPPDQRYWRGPVLTQFDGRTWRAARFATFERAPYETEGAPYVYTLILEPHNQPWLLPLEFPGPDIPGVRYASDYQLLAMQRVRNRMRIELRAFPSARAGLNEASDVLRQSLALPEQSNPRARALAERIASETSDHDEIVGRTLAYLREARLTYTLSPPLMGAHAVDEFLFDHQRGFCEHFASAFVVLMRAANVPARVVTGYQGGTLNPVDGALVVRQSDAHAWAEVWLEGEGWRRIDPTALAAPMRIESGLAAALPSGESLPLMMRPAMSWMRDLRHRWDALSNTWNELVIGFDSARQIGLVERLGFSQPDWKTLTTLLGLGTGTLLLMLFGWALFQRRRIDPLERAWAEFCRKFARRGLPRLPWEGPIDYADRVSGVHPDHAGQVRAIASHYARLRYGSSTEPDRKDVRLLTQRIHRFHLR